ncbi:hypothetical protein [Phenylobacterium sp.]|uniref:hypothetical protein n=1 Tax=Phenylobacterium sp. TaxID=1871053 RepID=UPI002C134F8F|nr:hypothetical protein [Phenylobacterium sp.]HVI33745.1 hypothetical protein [Phenylobacterium sp.]
MVPATPSTNPRRPAPARLWRLTRLSLAYLLDQIHLSRNGADIVDRLLIAAVIDANLGAIKLDQGLQFTYGALDAPSPDALLRPVSVNAVAQSVGLPFETVRRRIARLTREGACVAKDGGIVVPQTALASPGFKRLSVARFERLRQFHADLLAAGALPDIGTSPTATTEPRWDGDDPPVRVVNRILAEHLLRFIEAVMRQARDPLAALLLLEAARANIQHLPGREPPEGYPVADRLRRPVPISTLAARLNIPAETLRRRAARLERAGLCRRTEGGLIVPAAAVARPQVLTLMEENAGNVRRMFARLDQIGCLKAWSEAPIGGHAAPRC